MKRIGVLFCFLFLLSGCSDMPAEIERGMALRSKLLQAASVCFDADITADYGEKVYSFSMNCTGNQDGDLAFTVTSPETISGISGVISDEGGRLTFDDTALQFDLMADEQLSPVSSPWVLLKTLRSGYLTSACTEDGKIRLTIDDSYEEDALHLDIWLDTSDIPIRAEILYDGKRILSLDVKNFAIL